MNLKIILLKVFWKQILKALLICGVDVGSRLFFSICIANVLDKVKEADFDSAFWWGIYLSISLLLNLFAGQYFWFSAN